MVRPPLVAVVGPTASGKTELALALARHLDGEIVNADSRQVFRLMDIGTAKPTAEQRSSIPHHLLDVVDPHETLGLAQYLDLAHAALTQVWSRGRVPVLVGGTGQYVWALLEGWRVPRVPPQPELRAALKERAEREGLGALYDELRRLDPVAAERVDRANVRRLVRAIEVAMVRGPIDPSVAQKDPPDWDIRLFAIDLPREKLYERIDARVAAMLEAGLVDEVRRLRAAGYGDAFAMNGIGYREVSAYLDGAIGIEEVADRMRAATHRLARTQFGWFRRDDARITWLPPERALELAIMELRDLVSPKAAATT